MFLGAVVGSLFASTFCIIFGYLIWKKEELSLISGYNEKTFSGDKEKLARGIGILLIVIGILTILLPFGLEFVGSITGIIYGFIVVVGSVVTYLYVKSRK
ncbi:DUF3784 domain-containing protein [Sporosarcina sp. FA9]|uniref:DUF3784 domain-containing protein n=1 Tax=Sporosarcina sp. FA9 TaxID=3413030 RepID=UPI003F65A4BE